jgi:hypothetical protein
VKTTRRQLVQLAALPLLGQQPRFFNADDFAALQAFAEILIPTDETPGAREAKCADYIDFWLSSGAAAAPWQAAMTAIRSAGFHSADRSGKIALVEAFSKTEHPCHSAFLLIKERTAFAFYTSHAGLIKDLDYRGNSYNTEYPACDHPEHKKV